MQPIKRKSDLHIYYLRMLIYESFYQSKIKVITYKPGKMQMSKMIVLISQTQILQALLYGIFIIRTLNFKPLFFDLSVSQESRSLSICVDVLFLFPFTNIISKIINGKDQLQDFLLLTICHKIGSYLSQIIWVETYMLEYENFFQFWQNIQKSINYCFLQSENEHNYINPKLFIIVQMNRQIMQLQHIGTFLCKQYFSYIINKPNTIRSMMTTDLTAHLPVYIFRVLHIASMIGLSFKIINDYLRNTVFIQYDMVFLLMTLISMGSGYINTFLLQPQLMGQRKKLWISWHHIKLLVTLMLFMPIYKFLPILTNSIVNARFYWLVALVFLSPAAKYYREHFQTLNEFKKA